MGSNSTTVLGWIWNQHAYNGAWQQVKKCPISSHYWPTSPVLTSFILTSWAHLSFPSHHPGTTVLSRTPGWDTQKITPPNFRHGSWRLMNCSVTDIHLDKDWLSLSIHWVYSGSTMRPKGQPLACCVWRHLWLCRSKRLAARKYTSFVPARSALGILVPQY